MGAGGRGSKSQVGNFPVTFPSLGAFICKTGQIARHGGLNGITRSQGLDSCASPPALHSSFWSWARPRSEGGA